MEEFLDPTEQIETEEAPTSCEIGVHDAADLPCFQFSKTQAEIEHSTPVVHHAANQSQIHATMLH